MAITLNIRKGSCFSTIYISFDALIYVRNHISFPANAGSIFLAGQVVRLNVCVGRETLREFEGERAAK